MTVLLIRGLRRSVLIEWDGEPPERLERREIIAAPRSESDATPDATYVIGRLGGPRSFLDNEWVRER